MSEQTRVRLLYTSDEHTKLRPGAEGTISFIDSMRTIHVDWDDGSTLGLIPGVDSWEVLSKKKNGLSEIEEAQIERAEREDIEP